MLLLFSLQAQYGAALDIVPSRLTYSETWLHFYSSLSASEFKDSRERNSAWCLIQILQDTECGRLTLCKEMNPCCFATIEDHIVCLQMKRPKAVALGNAKALQAGGLLNIFHAVALQFQSIEPWIVLKTPHLFVEQLCKDASA